MNCKKDDFISKYKPEGIISKKSDIADHSFEDFVDIILRNKDKKEKLSDLELEESIDTKVNSFLKKHANMSYPEFVSYSHPEDIEEDSYGLFKRKSIRRSLFVSRSKAYLEALYDFEINGGDVDCILDEIREYYVPTLKREEGREPTYEAIFSILKN